MIGVIHKLRLQQWGEGGVDEMSTLLHKFGKFYQLKLSTRGGRGGGRKRPRICKRSCERLLMIWQKFGRNAINKLAVT